MTSPQGPKPGRAAVWISLALCSAAAFWVADGVAPWGGERLGLWHHYEYMAEGFLAGHTYLSLEPAPELATLRDPYDPAENAPYRLWDASLYHGKYYLYYGPAPAVALMVPWRILTGHALPQRMAVAVFAAAGLAALALLLLGVRAACFPGLSGLGLGAVLLTAFHAAWLPVILRRPGIWELPIVSSVACLWWALYFLWKFHASGGKSRWAVGIGIALALLMGCRVTFVFAAMVIAALALLSRGGPSPSWSSLRRGLPAAAIAFAGGIALLAYNHARFGRWLEFGQSYQLWGIDYRGMHLFSPRFLLFNARAYLLSLPEFGPYFPFLHPLGDYAAPEGHFGTEELYGVLFMMPVHLAGLAALAWAWRRRREAGTGPTCVLLAAAAAASALSLLYLSCFAGLCSRYMTELLAGWTVVTSVGLMAVFAPGDGPRPGRAVRVLAAAAACWTIACVWLASAEFRGFMRQTNPATYRAVAHALDYPSEWWIRSRGIRFAPIDLDVVVPPPPSAGASVLVASGFQDMANRLVIERTGAERVRMVLKKNEDVVLEVGPVPTRSGRLRVRLAAPWLYPPPEHPYWDAYGDPEARRKLQTLFALDWGLGPQSVISGQCFDASGFDPAIRWDSGPDPGSPFVASASLAPQP